MLKRWVGMVALWGAFVAPRGAAQTTVTGTVADATTEAALPGAAVQLIASDSTRVGTSADADGSFRLRAPCGEHRLRVSFVGYHTLEQTVTVGGRPVDLGRLTLRPDTTELGETVVEAIETRVTLRGDTLVYNAGAFGVREGASLRDLVRRLPGVTVEGGEVRATGEAVQRVLVDGKEFFGDDPSVALDNLPADAVEAVEVYDQDSERAELTGVADGEEARTINVVTKPDRRRSTFGQAQAGVGTDRRFTSGGTLNLFDGDRRLSTFARADNVDPRTQRALGTGGASPGPRGRPPDSGITRTLTGGATLNDQWGPAEVSAAYTLTSAASTLDALVAREYLLSEAAGQQYTETRGDARDRLGHTLSLRAEAELSEATEVEARASLNVSGRSVERRLEAETWQPSGDLLNRSETLATGDGRSGQGDLRASLRHRFPTESRTLSASFRLEANAEAGDDVEDIERRLVDGADASTDAFGRRVTDRSGSQTLSGEVAVSEALSDAWKAVVAYRPSVSLRDGDREGLRLDEAGQFARLDSAVTSVSDQRLTMHTLGTDLQRQVEGFTVTLGVALRHERLAFAQRGPRAFDVSRTTASVLPSLRASHALGPRSSVDVSYRSNTQAPRPQQLRDVVDDANPLRLSTGNPDLETMRTHEVRVSLSMVTPEVGRMWMGMLNVRAVPNAIGTATVAPSAAPVVARGVTVAPGTQLTYPVNLGGSLNVSATLFHGRPSALLGGNLNGSASLRYGRRPSLVDGVRNREDALSGNANVRLSTTASERLDLSLSYGLSGRLALNSTRAGQSPGLVGHRGSADVTWSLGGGLSLRSRAALEYTPDVTGRDLGGVSPLDARLDLGVGYAFGADDRAEVRLGVADVFDQSASRRRQVTDLFVETRETEAVGRFVLASLTYALRPRGGRPEGVLPPGVRLRRE
ncbi:MAG: carboxypeptidase-like regulatory domain-containing protein [Bacteroidota bacterium]